MQSSRLKSLVPVKFTLLPAASTSQSSDSTLVESDKGKNKSEDAGVPICPSCKSNLHNNRVMFRKSVSLGTGYRV